MKKQMIKWLKNNVSKIKGASDEMMEKIAESCPYDGEQAVALYKELKYLARYNPEQWHLYNAVVHVKYYMPQM